MTIVMLNLAQPYPQLLGLYTWAALCKFFLLGENSVFLSEKLVSITLADGYKAMMSIIGQRRPHGQQLVKYK